jgi:signal transduction histidine kinase/DNA-binding response OmpR family regulator
MTAPEKVNILVVDDLAENLLVMGAVLEELHENVVTARSGAEALQLVLQDDFAVILLDVNMPDMDGYETAAYIRKRKKSALTPIIFITAYADEIHKAQGYSLGAVDYLLSPVVPDIVRTKVRVFVELFRMTQEVKRSADEKVALAQMQVARAAAEAAQAAAEEASRRWAFLAEISTELAGLLDFEATARNLARKVLPFLADFSAVRIPGEVGANGLIELAWQDPSDKSGIVTGSSLEILPGGLKEAMERVLASGKFELLDGLSQFEDPENKTSKATECLAPPTTNNGDVNCLPFSLTAAVVLPLRVRQEMMGVFILAVGPSGRRFHSGDIELMTSLAARAAIFLENARLYQQIKDTDRRKNEFLSMLAHELRNPMAPIQNAAEILAALDAPGEELQWIKGVIDRNVKQLARLVTDLLDISRITQGKIRLHLAPVEAAGIASQAIEISRPLIDSRKHQLSLSAPSEKLWVNGDATRLAQALANLLNNAAKYTEPRGRIELKIEKDADQIVFRVRDSGIGIPPEMLPKIFELFTQIDRSLDRSQGGLGIGLSLVRSVVEMHQGVVQACSAGLGKGSEFVVRLPLLQQPIPIDSGMESQVGRPAEVLAAAVSSNGHASAAASAKDGSASRRVLIVDDNRDSTESLALLLRLTGHQVETALDGATALKAARDYRPEVIFLDIGLPETDGYEIAKLMRQDRDLAKVTLIAMTGYGQEEDRRKAQEAGFDGHMVKPADPVDVEKLLAGFPLQ